MLRLEARPQPSQAMSLASPLIALAVTVLIGIVLFWALGKDPKARFVCLSHTSELAAKHHAHSITAHGPWHQAPVRRRDAICALA